MQRQQIKILKLIFHQTTPRIIKWGYKLHQYNRITFY